MAASGDSHESSWPTDAPRHGGRPPPPPLDSLSLARARSPLDEPLSRCLPPTSPAASPHLTHPRLFRAPAQIAAVAVHPAYQIAVVGNFDIAIVTIADPPSPTEYGAAGVAPAFINAFSRFPRPGTTLYVAGHGLTSGVPSPDAALSPTLRLTAVPINTWSQCNSWWRKRLPPSLAAQQIVPAASQPLQVCGGLGTADSTCLGDSGGALFERRSLGGRDFFRVFGVVSYGVSLEDDLCPVIHPTYFAATSAANAFISANM